MKRRISLPLMIAAVLVLPASASAVEIGSVPAVDDQWGCDNGGECVVMQDQVGGVTTNDAPGAGTLTSFRARWVSGPYRLVVVRPFVGAVAASPVFTGSGTNSLETHTLTTPLAVLAGDQIAIALGDTSRVGIRYANAEAGTSLTQYSNDGLLSFQDDGPHEVALAATFQAPPVTPGGGGQPLKLNPPPVVPDPLAALKAGKRPSAKIAGGKLGVSKRRVAKLSLTNPNGYTLKGSLTLLAGKSKLGKAKVNLPAGATKSIPVKLTARGFRTLRKKRRMKVTGVAKLKGPIGKAATIRRKLTLKAPPKPKKRKRSPAKKPGSGSPGSGTSPGSNLWNARKGTSGAYDDFQFKLDNGNITLTKPALLLVSCAASGAGHTGLAISSELFNLMGPWRLGNQSETKNQQSIAVNQLVSSGKRTITYKLTSSRAGDKITGKLTMSFFQSNLDPFSNQIWFVNCAGTQSFEAIQS